MGNCDSSSNAERASYDLQLHVGSAHFQTYPAMFDRRVLRKRGASVFVRVRSGSKIAGGESIVESSRVSAVGRPKDLRWPRGDVMTLPINLLQHGSSTREGHHRFERQNIDIEVYAAPAGSVTLGGSGGAGGAGGKGKLIGRAHYNVAKIASLLEEQFGALGSAETAAKELPVSVRSGEKKAALYCMLYCAMFCVLYCVLWRRRRSCLYRYAWKRREGGDNTLCVLCAVWRVLCNTM